MASPSTTHSRTPCARSTGTRTTMAGSSSGSATSTTRPTRSLHHSVFAGTETSGSCAVPCPITTAVSSPGHSLLTISTISSRSTTGRSTGTRSKVASPERQSRPPCRNRGTTPTGSACFTKVTNSSDSAGPRSIATPIPNLGEIYVIAIDPSRHGKGLGKPMTLAGLAWLADHGLEHGMLYVESDNDPANATYAAIGFSRHHTDRAYELERA